MKGHKILFSLWGATFMVCILQIIWGPTGIIRQNELQDYAVRLDQKVKDLQADSQRLQNRYDALRTSKEAVALEAEHLGYFQAGDVPVKIIGGPNFVQPEKQNYWTTEKPPKPAESLDVFFHLSWFLFFIGFFLLFMLFEKLFPKDEKPVKSDSKKITLRLPPVIVLQERNGRTALGNSPLAQARNRP